MKTTKDKMFSLITDISKLIYNMFYYSGYFKSETPDINSDIKKIKLVHGLL